LYRFLLSLALLAALAAGTAGAREVIPGPLAAEVIAVVDGDTLDVRVHVWLGQQVETRVRILGIDAPELRARCPEERQRAGAARDWLLREVAKRDVVLRDVRYDKYGGRVLAHVETEGGADLGRELLARHLARPYQGGRRDGWCAGE
jgi:endonuclease YncB( thermonuclease family)